MKQSQQSEHDGILDRDIESALVLEPVGPWKVFVRSPRSPIGRRAMDAFEELSSPVSVTPDGKPVPCLPPPIFLTMMPRRRGSSGSAANSPKGP